jgi:hypothetical protein
MSGHTPWADIKAGRTERQVITDEAISAAGSRSQPWAAVALAALEWVARGNVEFTADEVWAELDSLSVPWPDEPRAMGAVMRAGVAEGFIAPTDTVRMSTRANTATGARAHTRRIAIVRSLVEDAGGSPRTYEDLWPPKPGLMVSTTKPPRIASMKAVPQRPLVVDGADDVPSEVVKVGWWACATCGTSASADPFVGLDPTYGHGRCLTCGKVTTMRRIYE